MWDRVTGEPVIVSAAADNPAGQNRVWVGLSPPGVAVHILIDVDWPLLRERPWWVPDVPGRSGRRNSWGAGVELRRPVVLASDGELLDDVLRLAAAAGCDAERVPDAAALRQRWASAPLVLLDEAGALACAQARTPRRDGVVLVVRGAPEASVWQRAVAVGAEHVVTLPDAEPWLVGALADACEGPMRPGRVLTLVGGRGGAGASVLAAAVAMAAVRAGRHALLVDCDPLGGGLDLVVGAEDADGLRWPGLALGGGRIAASSLHTALPAAPVGPAPGGLTVLSCDREGRGPDPAAVAAVVEAGRRGGEVVVCDLPRQLTEAACAALDRADLSLVVVPAEVRACAAAARVIGGLLGRGRPDRKSVV